MWKDANKRREKKSQRSIEKAEIDRKNMQR